MKSLLQEVRFALRALIMSPGFTVVAVVTLALGIGTNTAFFSILDAVLLRPYPYEDADRLVVVRLANQQAGTDSVPLAFGDFVDIEERARSYEGLAAVRFQRMTIATEDTPWRVRGATVSHDLIEVVRSKLILGRSFSPEEDSPGGPKVAILSERLWRSRFDNDPGIVGRQIRIDGTPTSVIGVVEEATQLPAANDAEVFIPIALGPNETSRHFYRYFVVGRLSPNVDLATADAEAALIGSQIERENPELRTGWSARVISLRESRTGNDRPVLLLGLAAVFFVLLIACANVGSLLLQRGVARQRVIAVRAALGASRLRLLSQLLLESVLLAVAAAALGLLVAKWLINVTVSLLPPDDLPSYMSGFDLDLRGVIYILFVTSMAVLVVGLVPALKTSRPNLNTWLADAGGRSGGAGRGGRGRRLLLLAEISLSVVLVVVAGLLFSSFRTFLQLDPGFDRSVTVVELPLPETRYPDAATRGALYKRVITEAENVAGIESIAAAAELPFGGWAGTAMIRTNEDESTRNRTALFGIQRTYGAYFQTIGQPLLAGRDFSTQDDAQSVPVAIISERGAQRFFPNANAVGELVKFPEISGDTWVSIVGVVATTKRRGLTNDTSLEVYVPVEQTGWPEMDLLIKSRAGVNVVGGARELIRGIDSELTTDQTQTLGEIVDRSLAMQKVSSSLAGIFAIFALLMAAVGMYGVIAYSVSQRTQEIGVRIAMGARSRDVFKLVIGQMLVISLVGSVLGLVGAAALSRLMASLLYGFQLNDLAIFALGVVLAIVIALVSSFFPARRASRIDPISALRVE